MSHAALYISTTLHFLPLFKDIFVFIFSRDKINYIFVISLYYATHRLLQFSLITNSTLCTRKLYIRRCESQIKQLNQRHWETSNCLATGERTTETSES